MNTDSLTGRVFEVDLGPFSPRLTFLPASQMRLQAQVGPTVIDEVLPVDVQAVRSELFLVTWKEATGNYIVQLQDHQNGVVFNRARLADGTFLEVEGTIRPL